MGFYQYKRELLINRPIEEVWEVVSNPSNLQRITPNSMGFEIKTSPQKEMYPGMIIAYRVSPLLRIPMTWVTEITQVHPLKYFVDEQRVGPYKMWHHEHILKNTDQGVLMSDIVSYQPPLGILGALANALFIKSKLKQIFDYREEAFSEIFDL